MSFSEQLAMAVRSIGEELANNAEKYIPDESSMVDTFHINIDVVSCGQFSMPKIDVYTTYFPKTWLGETFYAKNTKEAADDE